VDGVTADFYERDGLHVAVYDQFAAERVASQMGDDAGFYLETARATGGPVLEVACGTGRVAWQLADDGFEVVGLDLSAPMLRRAEAKRPGHPGTTIEFVEGDMARFDLERAFGLIVVANRSFQLLTTVEQQRAALACLRRHLDPDGVLVIDVFDPRLEYLVPGARIENTGRYRHPERGTVVALEATDRQVDPVAQVFTEVWRFREIDDGGHVLREEHEVLRMRWGYRYEMRYLFEANGFVVEAEYSGFDRSPPAYAKEQIWVLRPA
jgi:SAM-dependent methyltransferase